MGMKGHPESNCGRGGSGGGWTKKNMAVVVILVGLMGVMVVQKVKDKRWFNLVIEHKDRQILNLQLLLQKERQYAKDNKRKNQDLNAKLYSLGTQKIELSNKIMGMRSIISSLRDEQRVLELAINEKQNQIKHKEAEIQDLKSSLQTPPKIWSVSSDDPSNPTINLTNVVINPDVKVQKPNDEKLSSSNGYNSDAKIEVHNPAYGLNDGQNGTSVSQWDKSLIAKTDGQNEKSQLKAKRDEGPTEFQEGNKTRSETDRMDEDEAETDIEADLDSSRNFSEADQDYKEETEE
ncbi:hypothetical protein QVD17_18159 [Tagetes erecta]|uniref:Uncharacterized protein n=1 Tax=Tagetes erecta TaxID=13708 RepID=A0AAD8KH93_TARER|nr:hypothetical protein QVD17_18159 [Tagetes erecta]